MLDACSLLLICSLGTLPTNNLIKILFGGIEALLSAGHRRAHSWVWVCCQVCMSTQATASRPQNETVLVSLCLHSEMTLLYKVLVLPHNLDLNKHSFS